MNKKNIKLLDKVKELQTKMGLSDRDVAKIISITNSYISHISMHRDLSKNMQIKFSVLYSILKSYNRPLVKLTGEPLANFRTRKNKMILCLKAIFKVEEGKEYA